MSSVFIPPTPPRLATIHHPDCSAIADNTFKARHGSGPDLVPVNNSHQWAFGIFFVTVFVLIFLGLI